MGSSLCYETDSRLGGSSRACFGCGRLAGIDADPDRRRIDLEWAEPPDAPRPIAAIGRTLEWLGPDRPMSMGVDSRGGFEAARDGFENVLEAFEQRSARKTKGE